MEKVIDVDEEEQKLLFSEKKAIWAKYSGKINEGDVFDGRVGMVHDYGAFVNLRFPDGMISTVDCLVIHTVCSEIFGAKGIQLEMQATIISLV